MTSVKWLNILLGNIGGVTASMSISVTRGKLAGRKECVAFSCLNFRLRP